jgi:hypothetical protein
MTLDGPPIPTDLKVVPAACPLRWSTEGYDGHSRTTPQAWRSGLAHLSRSRRRPDTEAIATTVMSPVSNQICARIVNGQVVVPAGGQVKVPIPRG